MRKVNGAADMWSVGTEDRNKCDQNFFAELLKTGRMKNHG